MPILSLTGPRAAFIAFGRAKLWPFLLLFGLIFSHFTASAMCANLVVNSPEEPLMARTHFIDLQKLAQVPKAELHKQTEAYLSLQMHLETKIQQLLDGVSRAADHVAYDDLSLHLGLARDQEQLVREYLNLIEKMANSRFKLPAMNIVRPRVIPSDRTNIQVMSDIVADLSSLRKDKSKLIIRFIPIARQYLTLEYGTDLYGQPFSPSSETLGQGFLIGEREGLLKQNGLKMHDGFEGMTLKLTQNYVLLNQENGQRDEDKVYAPFPGVHNFMQGKMAIAVYDLDQLDDTELEFYIFKSPAERKKALLALITPVRMK